LEADHYNGIDDVRSRLAEQPVVTWRVCAMLN